jgi:2-hydroxychromene-2-carboxylate isomerase
MRKVDFYFDYSSTNSYFAAFLLPEICRRRDAIVNWLPIHSAALFRGTGFDVMAMTPRKARYLWRDHQRYAEFTGLPFRRPSRFPIKTSAALRTTLMIPGLVGENPDNYAASAMGDFAQAVMRAYWERDADISDINVLSALVQSLGVDSDHVIAAAGSDDARAARDGHRTGGRAGRVRSPDVLRRRRNVLGQGSAGFRRAIPYPEVAYLVQDRGNPPLLWSGDCAVVPQIDPF